MKEQLTALYSLQQQDSAIDLLKKQFAALDSGRVEKPTYEAAAKPITAQAQDLFTQRTEDAKPIPPASLKRYASLKAVKNGIAVATLEDGNACSGCKMGLPSQLVKAVQAGSDIQVCQNCG